MSIRVVLNMVAGFVFGWCGSELLVRLADPLWSHLRWLVISRVRGRLEE
jgi:hypothetical protein